MSIQQTLKLARAAQQQEPVAGKGKEFSDQLKLCARNVAFAASGHVDMSLAAMQEMFALIDHVCVGLDSPPAQQQGPAAVVPLTDNQIMASVGRNAGGEKTSISESRPLGQQWEQICELVRCVIRERYTPPQPSKPWVNLTKQEIDKIYRDLPHPVPHWQLSRAIEAKLREKNA